MLRAYPQTVAELEWYFNEAEGAIKSIRSTWADEVQVRAAQHVAATLMRFRLRDAAGERWVSVWTEYAPLRCGPIYVPKGGGGHDSTYEMDTRGIAAAGRERRIRAALVGADREAPHALPPWLCPAPPSEALRQRFRELLLPARIPFGLAGQAGRRGRPVSGAIGIRLNAVRGPGNLAHLVPSTIAAWAASRTTLDIFRWTDRLGMHLGPDGSCTAPERELGKAIARECELLEVQAIARYRSAIQRVPERVRRAARERNAA